MRPSYFTMKNVYWWDAASYWKTTHTNIKLPWQYIWSSYIWKYIILYNTLYYGLFKEVLYQIYIFQKLPNPLWRHQMETFFSRCRPYVRGNHRSPVTLQRPVTRSFDMFFDLRLSKKAEQTIETPLIWYQSPNIWIEKFNFQILDILWIWTVVRFTLETSSLGDIIKGSP